MKKIIFITTCLTLVWGMTFSQNSAKSSQNWSLEEVKNMVKKYNLQDSVTATKNNGLMYADKIEIEKWAKSWVRAIEQQKERESFFNETQKVRTRADYYKVLETHPLIKQQLVNMQGGEVNYEKHKAETLKTNWRVYRNKKGELAFLPANRPIRAEEKQNGQRIDNLPPQKQ